MYEKFKQEAFDKLGHYVYALFDPRDTATPFYVGEGQGNRVFSHAEGDYAGLDRRSRKQEIISGIQSRNERVVHKILVWGLPRQEDAQIIESTLIQLLQHMNPLLLTNLNRGMGRQITDTRDLAGELNAEELVDTGDVVGLVVKINRNWNRWTLEQKLSAADISREMLFQAARGDWVRNLVRVQPHKVVLVVAHGIVRDVFYADEWVAVPETNPGRVRMGERTALTDSRAETYRPLFVGRSVRKMLEHATRPEVMYLPLNRQIEALEDQGPEDDEATTSQAIQ